LHAFTARYQLVHPPTKLATKNVDRAKRIVPAESGCSTGIERGIAK
jgi:hypothetical protein